MKYKQYDIWLADLNPTFGKEPGKTRPLAIVQTDLFNDSHLFTIVCPITKNIKPEAEILRVHLKKSQLQKLSDVLVYQPRAIDNKRFVKRMGKLTNEQAIRLKENLKIVFDLKLIQHN